MSSIGIGSISHASHLCRSIGKETMDTSSHLIVQQNDCGKGIIWMDKECGAYVLDQKSCEDIHTHKTPLRNSVRGKYNHTSQVFLPLYAYVRGVVLTSIVRYY